MGMLSGVAECKKRGLNVPKLPFSTCRGKRRLASIPCAGRKLIVIRFQNVLSSRSRELPYFGFYQWEVGEPVNTGEFAFSCLLDGACAHHSSRTDLQIRLSGNFLHKRIFKLVFQNIMYHNFESVFKTALIVSVLSLLVTSGLQLV